MAASEARARRWPTLVIGGSLLTTGWLSVLIYHVAPLGFFPWAQPSLPSVLLQKSEVSFVDADYTLTPDTAASARRAAAEAPLEATPFYYAAMETDEASEPEKVIALLDETLRRDPRQYYARLWRARMYYRTGRLAEAVADIERVISIDHDPDHSNEYMDALVDLARDPRSHAFLLQRIAQGPPWANDFILRANATLEDEDFLLALASRSSTALNDYVRTIANKGDYERAFLIWQTSLPEEHLLGFSWPADPRFKPADESNAFGWSITSGIAKREEDGLYVYFNGRAEKLVASQIMLLGPGYHYELMVSMSGKIDTRGGFFQWDLKCLESHQVVASLQVKEVHDMRSSLSATAFVPEDGCAIQSLSLVAKAGEYPYPSRVTIHEVAIREIAGGEPEVTSAVPDTQLGAQQDSKAGP